jgi:hypothetical protein
MSASPIVDEIVVEIEIRMRFVRDCPEFDGSPV